MTARANELTSRANPPAERAPVIQACHFRVFVDAFERLGYEVEPLLEAIGLRRSDLDDPDRYLACEICGQCFSAALKQRPLRNLGMQLATATPMGAFALLDYLAVTCDDVGSTVKQLARYFPLINAPLLIEIDDTGDPIRLRHICRFQDNGFNVEYHLTLVHHHLREETDGQFRFKSVSLSHEPDDVRELDRVLGCQVTSRAAWDGVNIDRAVWELPMRRRDPLLRTMLEEYADGVTARLPKSDQLMIDVRRAIVRRLPQGDASIGAIARDLALSSRTLQRRLATSGFSYQELFDRTSRELAEKHLSESALSIAEIACLLGYSEPAPFHRAFKRWSGMTPDAYRKERKRKRGAVAMRVTRGFS